MTDDVTQDLASRPDDRVPDTSEMAVLHLVFRKAFDSAPDLVGGVADDDAQRAEVVGSFYANVLEFLHVHHQGEDALLFPKLLERETAAPDRALIERIAGQHQQVDSAVQAAETALAAWRATPTAAARSELIGALTAMDTALTAHLDEEEQLLMPYVERHITFQEWHQLPGHALGAFRGDNIWLIIGLLREGMPEDQRAAMLAAMPPPVVEAWQTVGLESYRRTVAELVGAAD